MALNLAAALRERGHDAIAWSTEPLPRQARFWNAWLWQRRRLEAFLAENPPFDVIDLPAVSISGHVRSHGRIVARSVQPDLRYFACALADELRRGSLLHLAINLPQMIVLSAAILAGWRRAGVILCLGSHESDWMRRKLPWTRRKLARYLDALSPADQASLAELRARRAATMAPRSGLRFLWIGRWVPQKGTRRLLRFITERARARPEDTFTVAGCGDQAVRDCPPDLVAAGRLRLVPSFSRGELPQLLGEHDAGLFTSIVEGWGLSLNEMLESGMPVFATRAGGVEDLAPCFPGTLLPFPPPTDFEIPRPPGDLAAGNYLRHFTWKSIAESYEERVLAREMP
ncbi:MAG TPA: glycosyltransferase family 4 protein [Thermoanaerobaculia bacterium]|jgi:glycosyltransferase involved in cell wall biosynthesis|nr:glycosyltransferase family 4 protein [Thermoanaerobaculia bacterium]